MSSEGIHQLITFEYFEHQPIADLGMAGACGLCAGPRTIEFPAFFGIDDSLVRENVKFLRLGSVFRRLIHRKTVIRRGLKMAISVQNPILKISFFLSVKISKFYKYHGPFSKKT